MLNKVIIVKIKAAFSKLTAKIGNIRRKQGLQSHFRGSGCRSIEKYTVFMQYVR